MEEAKTSFNDFVVCPYNKAHILLRGRLTKHLIRCSLTATNSKELKVCPFNENHRFNAKELSEHVKVCPDRVCWEPKIQSEDQSKQSGKISAVVECEDDWDNEPDVPSYDPTKYCEENLVVRSTPFMGKSKAVREELRAQERRRFANLQ